MTNDKIIAYYIHKLATCDEKDRDRFRAEYDTFLETIKGKDERKES